MTTTPSSWTPSTSALTLAAALVATLGVGAAGCRDPAELSGAVTANVFVVGVDDGEVVEIEVEGLRLQAQPNPGDNLVGFALSLAVGEYDGLVTVFESTDDDGVLLRPRDCGAFTITVDDGDDAGAPAALAIVADDLAECDEVDEDGAEGVDGANTKDDVVDDSGEP